MKNANRFLFAAAFALSLFSACTPPNTTGQNGEAKDTIPIRGDWVRMGIPNEPDVLHPYVSTHATATYIRDHMFQFLTDIDPRTLGLEPVLVTALPVVSEDQLSYEYHLRPEATWDDGKPITAHDYAFSVKAVVNPLTQAPHMRGYYEFIRDVVIDPNDDRHFTVKTGKIFFLADYALGGFEVIPKHKYDPKGLLDKFTIAQMQDDVDKAVSNDPAMIEFADSFYSDAALRDPAHIFGSGPYRLESWTPGEKLVLARKDNWWGDKIKENVFAFRAYPDKLVYKGIQDRAASIRAIAAGEVDMIWDVLPDEFDRLMTDSADQINKTCNFHVEDSYSWTYLGMNARPSKNRKPVLAEQPVRRAVAHLCDIDRIIKTVYNGYGSRIVGPISPHNKNEYHTGLKPIPFSIEKAIAILDSAGWKDTDGDGIRDKVVSGKKIALEIELLVSTSSATGPNIAAIIAEDAIKAGVKINLNRLDFRLITERLAKHDFDMYGLGMNGSPIPADLVQIWHTESWLNNGSNYTGFGDSTSDRIIEQIRVTVDVEERRKLYWQIQEIIYDYQPMVFVMSQKERFIIHKRYKGQETTVVRPGFKSRAFWVPKENQQFGNKPS